MDVSFEPTRGRPFTIEVGYFDTVSEIKEKIQKYHGIPVPTQTLVFNGKDLQDDVNIHDSNILDRSNIQLILEDETETNDNGHAIWDTQSSPTPSNKIHFIVKLPNRAKPSLNLEMEPQDTIKKLKEKIQEMESLPMNKLVLHCNGKELRDHNKSLQDYTLSDFSEVDVSLKTSSTSSSGSSGGTNGSKTLRITILSKCGTNKMPLGVSHDKQIAELRKDLEKLSQEGKFDLPPEGYFFIHKQRVMDDDKSISWHKVKQGDTIEIFNGSVTGGS